MYHPDPQTSTLKDVTPLDILHATSLSELAAAQGEPAEIFHRLQEMISVLVDRGGAHAEGQQLLRMLFWHTYTSPEVVLALIGAHCLAICDAAAQPAQRRRSLYQVSELLIIPVAELMGLWRLRRELANICLNELHPGDYARMLTMQGEVRQHQLPVYGAVVEQLKGELSKAGIHDVEISEHVSSVARLHWKRNRGLTQGDMARKYAFDVLVGDEVTCYLLPYYIHRLWEPMTGRSIDGYNFRDLIAESKHNGYRSLITTVAYRECEDGQRAVPLEFRIFTREIAQTNNDGVVASLYCGKTPVRIRGAWWLDDDLISYVASRPLDSVTPEIFVFSPRGKIYPNLPRNSTPIDYAYHVHSDIGNHCKQIWVNGSNASPADRLKNGQIVRIEVDESYFGPDEKWLQYVETTTAKRQIRRAIQSHRKPRGREIIDRILANELEWYGLDIAQDAVQKALETTARDRAYMNVDALYIDVVEGRVSPDRIASALITGILGKHIRPADASVSVPRRIEFARCFHARTPCRVTPGTTIVGRIVRAGRPSAALKVYRTDCPNAPHGDDAIPLTWLGHRMPGDIVRITASAVDRPGLLGDVLAALYELQGSTSLRVLGVHAGVNRDRSAELELDVETPDTHSADMIRSRLHDLKRRDILGDFQVDPLSPIDKILLSLPDSLPNPYTTGPANWRIFKGRQAELMQLAHYLRANENYIVIIGGNRIGKTSLLRYAETHIVPELNMVPIVIDMQGLPDQSEESFWREVAGNIERAYSKRGFGLGGESSRAGTTAYAEFMQNLRDNKSYVNRPPVLLIDEMNVVDELWVRKHAVLFIQHLLAFAKRFPEINVVLSLQEDLYNAASVGIDLPTAGLLDMGTRIRLGYLSHEDARRVVVDPLVTMLHYDEAVVDKIVGLTAGHPYYLQKMLERVVERASIDKTGKVTEEWLLSVLERIYESKHEFHDFLRKTYGFQRKVLVALADHCTSAKDGATAGQLAVRLQGDFESVESTERALEDLCLAGVIQRNAVYGDGVYRIDVPLFQQWLIRDRLTSLQAGSTALEQERLYE